MDVIAEMLKGNPRYDHKPAQELSACIHTCVECSEVCRMCADACLREGDIGGLIRCIDLNLSCSAVCDATAAVASRLTSSWSLSRTMLLTCITACKICGDECSIHAVHHQHCSTCAEACEHCRIACLDVLAKLPMG
jgi:hypothetical protein